MTDLAALYSSLEPDRQPYLEVAYRSSVLTIPSLLPREGTLRSNLPQNYQSIGARGVNNLTSKLRLTLFPVELPFFRLSIDPFAERALVAELGEEEAARARAEITKNLSLIEETARVTFQTEGWGPATSELLRHLVVTGNGMILEDSVRGPQFIDMRRFVAERDPEGNLLSAVARQEIADSVVYEVTGEPPPTPEQKAAGYVRRNYLYTGAVRLPDGKFAFHQQINGTVVPGSERVYTADTLPILVFRFAPIYGENYGLGYVGEYDGDLLSLESLSRALVEAALAAAKLLFLVRPGSATRPNTVATAPNGAIRSGNAEDVTVLNVQKQADLATAERRAAVIEQRLSYAFLLFSSVQRQAERVTAEEVRLAAQELEDALGGVYTSLADNLQRPIVNYLLAKLRRRSDLPKLPSSVRPMVATGLEAISRGHKAMRLMQFGQSMQSIVGPEETAAALRPEVIARELAVALQLDPDSLIRSPEEVAELRQQQTNQALVESLGPQAISAASRQPQ